MHEGAAPKRAPLPPGRCQPAAQQSGEDQAESGKSARPSRTSISSALQQRKKLRPSFSLTRWPQTRGSPPLTLHTSQQNSPTQSPSFVKSLQSSTSNLPPVAAPHLWSLHAAVPDEIYVSKEAEQQPRRRDRLHRNGGTCHSERRRISIATYGALARP